MNYKVHKFEVGSRIDEVTLEMFLNGINGEIVTIIPNIIPKFHLMGATGGYDYLLVIEKIR